MSDLVNMAYTKAELKERNSPKTSPSYLGEAEKYPYGLNITLNEDQIKKLGIKLPKSGSMMSLHAQCKVVSVSSNDRANGGTDRRIELQMQKMCVEPGAMSAMDAMDDALEDASDPADAEGED